MKDINKHLETINDAKMASIVAHHLGGLIAQAKERRLAQLTQLFRGGSSDHATLIAGISGYCALEDLERDIRQKIVKGEIASREMNGDQDGREPA